MFQRLPSEAIIWLTGLVALALLEPGSDHFSLCPLSQAGIDFCPGCGLGKSISLLFRGHIKDSFQAHPLGIFAVIVLSSRIVIVTKHHFQYHGKSN